MEQFLNQNEGNVKAGNEDTVLIEKELKIDTIAIDANTNLTFEIKDGASLTINEKMDVSGKIKIVGEGKFIIDKGANTNILENGVLDIDKDIKVENNGKIENNGQLIIPDIITGSGGISGSGDIDKIHDSVYVPDKEPTCTEDGVKAHWYCKSCNKYYSNEELTKEITDVENLIIPAKGHQYDDRGKCTVCGAVTAGREAADKVDKLIDAIGPADKVTIDSKGAIMAAKKAYNALTDEQKKLVTGLDDLNAAIDAYNALLEGMDTEKPIDKPTDKEDSKGVQTGDTTAVGLLVAMLLLSGAGIVGLRRKYQ